MHLADVAPLCFIGLVVWSLVRMGQQEKQIAERVSADLRYAEDGIALRSTWRAPLSYRWSRMTAGLRITGTEAFLFRSRGSPIQLVLREGAHEKLGYRLRVTSMQIEGRALVIEGRRDWASATLRLDCSDPGRALRMLRAVAERAGTYRTSAAPDAR